MGMWGIVSTLYNIKYKNISNKNTEFDQWLSGFIDAEGNFQVVVERNKYVRLIFRINLHIDDIDVLKQIQKHLKVGYIETHKQSCTYVLRKIDDIIIRLLPVLEMNTLRTTKYFDYIDFRDVAYIIKSKSDSKISLDIVLIHKIINGMNSKRHFTDISKIPIKIININYIIGFVEGEGTFGFKNLIPYFQIGQHTRNKHVLEEISNYLESLNSLFTYSNKSPSIKINFHINKRTNVLVISNSNIDSLFDILVHHFFSCTFRTRKSVDFYYWCIVVYIKKYGYFYNTQGRDLSVSIANYINKSRYSTQINKDITIPVIDITFLTSTLPVKLIPDISHLQLSQKFSKISKNRLIWVYDNGNVSKDSPFITVANASESIGLSRTSMTVRRYLDTGKVYKNRYIFKSTHNISHL